MYSVDFESQLEASRQHLFGSLEPREASDAAYQRYSVPPEIRVVKCEENTRGEWVPIPDKSVDSVISH